MICMGWRIYRRTFPSNKWKWFVRILVCVYLICSVVNAILSAIWDNTNVSIPAGLITFFVFVLAIMEVIWYVSIVYNLVWSIRILTAHKRNPKYKMYKLLMWVMVACGLFALFLEIINLSATFANKEDAWFKEWWIFTAYWFLLFVVITVAVALIWRPVLDNDRYAYEELIEHQPNEGQPGDGSSVPATPKGGSGNDGRRSEEGSASRLEMM